MKRKKAVSIISAIIMIFLIVSGYFIYSSFSAVPKMFKLNSNLVSEGYYTSEFEFKMLGLAYYLDRGQYITAFAKINQLYNQLKSKQGFIKVPKFNDKKEEFEFFLNLQNPRTGAFMDDSYPFFTYYEPTVNIVAKLKGLAKETGQPLKLKYPLKFLDEISTGEKLKSYLDDLSTVGWVASKFKTPFVVASTMIYYGELEESNLYAFTPEWKQTLIKWFYDNQDSKTGFWGSKLRSSGQLLDSGDLGPTFHIVKLFVDNQGNNLHPEFPLRYKDEMFSTALKKLSKPIPKDANLDEIHDWSLTRYQGIKLITNFLWKTVSTENKSNAKRLIEDIVRVKFEKFYVKNKGSFSLYPGSTDADLDGTSDMLNLLNIIGAYRMDRQEFLWGSPEVNILDMGVHKVSELKESDIDSIRSNSYINSLRLYLKNPGLDSYLSDVDYVIYPRNTSVLDIVDLLPRLNKWIDTTSQTMGMWVPKESIKQELSDISIKPVKLLKESIPLNLLNDELRNKKELILIGFDILQIPRYRIVYKLDTQHD